MWSTSILLSFFVLIRVSATTLNLHIPPTVALPSPSSLLSSTFATLTTFNRTLHAPLRRSNQFTFSNIPAGSYLCDIYARDYAFTPLRVDVSAQGKVAVWQTFRGNEWDNKGERVGGGNGEEVTVEVQVLGPKNYYETRSGCTLLFSKRRLPPVRLTSAQYLVSPASLLQNPMILIAIVGMGMMFGMPYLMENSTFTCWCHTSLMESPSLTPF